MNAGRYAKRSADEQDERDEEQDRCDGHWPVSLEDHRPEHEPDHAGSTKSEYDAALEAAHDLGCELVFGHWIAPRCAG
jgi:hypothetical protein